MLVDVHSHIDQYTDLLPEALAQIESHRLTTVCVSMNVESFLKSTELATSSRYLIPAFGIHPWEAPRYHAALNDLDEYLKRTPLIGEAGLDFHFVKDASLYPSQRAVFEYQCRWARRCSLPMNLHTKGAEREVLEAIRTHRILTPIIHWYSGPVDLVGDYLHAGSYFTIGVEVLTSPYIQEIARLIPADRLFLETDNPGGYRWLYKTDGMPRVLLEVLGKVSRLRGTDPLSLEDQIFRNWLQIQRSFGKTGQSHA